MDVQRRLDASWAQLSAALRGTPPSDEILERQETRQLVTTAIASLRPEYRRVLEGKYVEDRSIADLAGQLDLSAEAIKSRLARARHAFRRAFLELCDQARAERRGTAEPATETTEAP
jgi:RNA polymerase sigma factor (sigma-70 family)